MIFKNKKSIINVFIYFIILGFSIIFSTNVSMCLKNQLITKADVYFHEMTSNSNEVVYLEFPNSLDSMDVSNYTLNVVQNNKTSELVTRSHIHEYNVSKSNYSLQSQNEGLMLTIEIIIFTILVISVAYLILYLRIQRKTKIRLESIAYHDKLTGLYNKTYLTENYAGFINKERRKIALVTIDIARFKTINEIYGEETGNYVLKHLTKVLLEIIKSNDLLVRNYGDEFIMLLNYSDEKLLNNQLENIISRVSKISYKDQVVQLKANIGVYKVIDNSIPFERAYSYAVLAKNEAKLNKEKYIIYFDDSLIKNEVMTKLLHDEILTGIRNKEFKAWFQPQIDSKTKKIISVEALARWYKGDKILSPYSFVSYAEKSGLIKEIDKIIFEHVCQELNIWKNKGLKLVPVCVNVSRINLLDSSAIYHLKKIADSYDIDPGLLQIEITESALAENEEELKKSIDLLHELGFSISLDDFGVGYTSLAAINNLNFDILKIDKSFVDSIGTTKGDRLIKYTISLGRDLGVKLVAEGIENEHQYEFLRQEDCDIIQGYYFLNH